MPIAENDPRPSASEARWFGVLLLVAFSVLGSVIGWQFGSLRFAQTMAGTGLALAVLFYAVRPLRVPLYRTWMALTLPLGRLISTLILGAIYYLAITPLGWLMRVFGRDHLQGRFDPSADTYWSVYDPGHDADRYFRQS